jgi:hypothetical protein
MLSRAVAVVVCVAVGSGVFSIVGVNVRVSAISGAGDGLTGSVMNGVGV